MSKNARGCAAIGEKPRNGPMLDYLDNHFSQAYYYQHERKEKIFSSITLPTSVIVVLVGGIFYYINILVPVGEDLGLRSWALFVLTLSIVSVVCAAFNVLRVAHNHTYEYIASPTDFQSHARELENYYTQAGHASARDAAKADLQETLVSQYAQSASRNAEVNERRLYYRNQAFKAISVAIVLLGLTATLNAVSVNTGRGEHSVERNIETGIGSEPTGTTSTEAAEAEAPADAAGNRRLEADQD